MSTSRVVLIALFVAVGTAFVIPAAGQVPPCAVTTTWSFQPPPPPPAPAPNPPIPIVYPSITAALNSAPATLLGGTVFVSGVCTEPEIFITERFINLTLIGNGVPGTQATLQGASAPLGGALSIRGRNITVRGFKITSAGAKYGVTVYRGGTGLIDNCVIDGFTGGGITVNQWAFARIVNNTVQNNGEEGIFVAESAAVRVGFASTDDPAPQPNTIRNNGLAGIRVTRMADARITANVITGNGEAGIAVENNSHADIAWNDLSGNNGAGVRVHLNSSARVGIGSGRADWNIPNSTTTPNLGAGLECTLGGAVEGTLGTLTGLEGSQQFGHGCMHDLTH